MSVAFAQRRESVGSSGEKRIVPFYRQSEERNLATAASVHGPAIADRVFSVALALFFFFAANTTLSFSQSITSNLPSPLHSSTSPCFFSYIHTNTVTMSDKKGEVNVSGPS